MAEEQPYYVVKDAKIMENFRKIYLAVQQHRHSGSDFSNKLYNVIPATGSTYNLGSNDAKWSNIFISSGIQFPDGTFQITSAPIQGQTQVLPLPQNATNYLQVVSTGMNYNINNSSWNIFNGSITVSGAGIASIIVGTGNFIVTQGGNVGVGSVSPSAKFTVSDGTAERLIINTSGDVTIRAGGGNGANGVQFQDDLGTQIFRFDRNNGMLLKTNLQFSPGGTYSIAQNRATNDPLNMWLRGYISVGSNGDPVGITAGDVFSRRVMTTGSVGIGNSVLSSILDVSGGSITVRGSNAGIYVNGGTVTANNFSVNQNSLFSTTMTNVNTFGNIMLVSTATIASNSTLTITPACPTGTSFVSPISVSEYNSAAVAAGSVVIGTYNFGDSTFPLVNRDVTDTKNVIYSILCR